MKTEFGQSKTVVATHMEEIINLPVTRGSNYERVCEFYEKLSKNFDALQTLGEGEMLKGFVLSTLNNRAQGTLGKNVVAGDAIGARANTTPACVISLRGTRRRIPMPL